MDDKLPPWTGHGMHNNRVFYSTPGEHQEVHDLMGGNFAAGDSMLSVSSCMSGAFKALLPDDHGTSSAMSANSVKYSYSPHNNLIKSEAGVQRTKQSHFSKDPLAEASAIVTHMFHPRSTQFVSHKNDCELDQGHSSNWTSVIKDALEMSNGIDLEQTSSVDVCGPLEDINPLYKGSQIKARPESSDLHRIAGSKPNEKQQGQEVKGQHGSFIAMLSDGISKQRDVLQMERNLEQNTFASCLRKEEHGMTGIKGYEPVSLPGFYGSSYVPLSENYIKREAFSGTPSVKCVEHTLQKKPKGPRRKQDNNTNIRYKHIEVNNETVPERSAANGLHQLDLPKGSIQAEDTNGKKSVHTQDPLHHHVQDKRINHNNLCDPDTKLISQLPEHLPSTQYCLSELKNCVNNLVPTPASVDNPNTAVVEQENLKLHIQKEERTTKSTLFVPEQNETDGFQETSVNTINGEFSLKVETALTSTPVSSSSRIDTRDISVQKKECPPSVGTVLLPKAEMVQNPEKCERTFLNNTAEISNPTTIENLQVPPSSPTLEIVCANQQNTLQKHNKPRKRKKTEAYKLNGWKHKPTDIGGPEISYVVKSDTTGCKDVIQNCSLADRDSTALEEEGLIKNCNVNPPSQSKRKNTQKRKITSEVKSETMTCYTFDSTESPCDAQLQISQDEQLGREIMAKNSQKPGHSCSHHNITKDATNSRPKELFDDKEHYSTQCKKSDSVRKTDMNVNLLLKKDKNPDTCSNQSLSQNITLSSELEPQNYTSYSQANNTNLVEVETVINAAQSPSLPISSSDTFIVESNPKNSQKSRKKKTSQTKKAPQIQQSPDPIQTPKVCQTASQQKDDPTTLSQFEAGLVSRYQKASRPAIKSFKGKNKQATSRMDKQSLLDSVSQTDSTSVIDSSNFLSPQNNSKKARQKRVDINNDAAKALKNCPTVFQQEDFSTPISKSKKNIVNSRTTRTVNVNKPLNADSVLASEAECPVVCRKPKKSLKKKIPDIKSEAVPLSVVDQQVSQQDVLAPLSESDAIIMPPNIRRFQTRKKHAKKLVTQNTVSEQYKNNHLNELISPVTGNLIDSVLATNIDCSDVLRQQKTEKISGIRKRNDSGVQASNITQTCLQQEDVTAVPNIEKAVKAKRYSSKTSSNKTSDNHLNCNLVEETSLLATVTQEHSLSPSKIDSSSSFSPNSTLKKSRRKTVTKISDKAPQILKVNQTESQHGDLLAVLSKTDGNIAASGGQRNVKEKRAVNKENRKEVNSNDAAAHLEVSTDGLREPESVSAESSIALRTPKKSQKKKGSDIKDEVQTPVADEMSKQDVSPILSDSDASVVSPNVRRSRTRKTLAQKSPDKKDSNNTTVKNAHLNDHISPATKNPVDSVSATETDYLNVPIKQNTVKTKRPTKKAIRHKKCVTQSMSNFGESSSPVTVQQQIPVLTTEAKSSVISSQYVTKKCRQKKTTALKDNNIQPEDPTENPCKVLSAPSGLPSPISLCKDATPDSHVKKDIVNGPVENQDKSHISINTEDVASPQNLKKRAKKPQEKILQQQIEDNEQKLGYSTTSTANCEPLEAHECKKHWKVTKRKLKKSKQIAETHIKSSDLSQEILCSRELEKTHQTTELQLNTGLDETDVIVTSTDMQDYCKSSDAHIVKGSQWSKNVDPVDEQKNTSIKQETKNKDLRTTKSLKTKNQKPGQKRRRLDLLTEQTESSDLHTVHENSSNAEKNSTRQRRVKKQKLSVAHLEDNNMPPVQISCQSSKENTVKAAATPVKRKVIQPLEKRTAVNIEKSSAVTKQLGTDPAEQGAFDQINNTLSQSILVPRQKKRKNFKRQTQNVKISRLRVSSNKSKLSRGAVKGSLPRNSAKMVKKVGLKTSLPKTGTMKKQKLTKIATQDVLVVENVKSVDRKVSTEMKAKKCGRKGQKMEEHHFDKLLNEHSKPQRLRTETKNDNKSPEQNVYLSLKKKLPAKRSLTNVSVTDECSIEDQKNVVTFTSPKNDNEKTGKKTTKTATLRSSSSHLSTRSRSRLMKDDKYKVEEHNAEENCKDSFAVSFQTFVDNTGDCTGISGSFTGNEVKKENPELIPLDTKMKTYTDNSQEADKECSVEISKEKVVDNASETENVNNVNSFKLMKVDSFTQYTAEHIAVPKVNSNKKIRSSSKETAKKPLACKYCGISFRHITAYIIHQRIHTGEKPYKCKYCGKTFAQLSQLKSHRNVHKQSFPCPCCGQKFQQKEDLLCHFKVHLLESEVSTEPVKDVESKRDTPLSVSLNTPNNFGSFICNICNKNFLNNVKLQIHMRMHEIEKPLTCKDCGKRFWKSSSLAVHEKRHWPVKPYACSVCGKGFIQLKALKKHSQEHTGETPFSCCHCGHAFSALSALRMHQASKTCIAKKSNGESCDIEGFIVSQGADGQVNTPIFFKCQLCKQLFKKWCQYTLHLQTHTSSSAYLCFACGQCYEKDSEINVHCKVCCHSSGEEMACGASLSEIMQGDTQTCPDSCSTSRNNLTSLQCTPSQNLPSTELKTVSQTPTSPKTDTEQLTQLPHSVEAEPTQTRTTDLSYLPEDVNQSPIKVPIAQSPTRSDISCASSNSSLECIEISPSLWKFQCPRCGQRFERYRILCAHMQTHAPGFRYTCAHCGQSFERWNKLWLHQRRHHSKGRCYSCTQCNLQFRFFSSYTEHMLYHAGQRPYACPLCPKTFIQEESLHAHQCESHKPCKSLKCDVCSKTFSSLGNLIKHSLLHNGSTSHVCLLCNLSFTNTRALQEHLKTHTSYLGLPLPDIPSEPLSFPYKCKRCKASFSTGDLLYAHQICHSRDKKTEVGPAVKSTSKPSDSCHSEAESTTLSSRKNHISNLNLDGIPNDESLFVYSHPDRLYVTPSLSRVRLPIINLDLDQHKELPDTQKTNSEIPDSNPSANSDGSRQDFPVDVSHSETTHLPPDTPGEESTNLKTSESMPEPLEEMVNGNIQDKGNYRHQYQTSAFVQTSVDMEVEIAADEEESAENFECADCSEKLPSVLGLYEHYILHAIGNTYVHRSL